MRIEKYLLIVFTVLWIGRTAGNPGILIALTFPLNIPPIDLSLPLSIDNIVISNLQLTNVYLRELSYSWTFNISHTDVSISYAQISFDWFYKKHQGVGFFTEENLNLQMHYGFIPSKTNHFQINITSTKIKPGHSKVTLGGGVPETVAIEVTNLILNHASILFRSFIGNQLSKVISGLGSTIGQDKQIYTDAATGKEFYLNLTLAAPPSAINQNLVIQLNGAPYIKGTSSGSLNPSDILIKTNSTKIQVQIHKQLLIKFISILLEAKGGDISLALHSLAITSTIDVNSLLLSPVFPPMVFFQDERDVIFNLKLPAVQFGFNGNNLKFTLTAFTNVYTHNTVAKRDQLYIDRIDGKVAIEIQPIFGSISNSLRIAKLQILDFSPHPSDVDKGVIVPDAIKPYFSILTQWLSDGINLDLNKKVVSLAYNNVLAKLKGSVIKNIAYCLQIDLTQI